MIAMVKLSLMRAGKNPMTEYRLPNNKIADVYYQDEMGEVIIECKTMLIPSMILCAWRKYSEFCNLLIIAGPERNIRAAAHESASFQWRTLPEAIGYAIADWEGYRIVTPPLWRISA